MERIRRSPASCVHAALVSVAGLAVVAAGCATTSGVATVTGTIEVLHPWVPAPASPSVGALYFTLRNTGSTPDQLTGISSPVSASATLHVDNPDGSMSTAGPLAIGPRASATLSPGHEHVMLENLDRTLVAGQTISVDLRFAHAGAMTVRVPVLPVDAAATGEGGG